ncbi:thiamine pyrophosphate-dependent enzyme [Caenibacillus caldisaponilyticus]|uniref:thiamine pyrophosphate-dependent enzyme n=1 Tax=Caenibacillus caldisaponilyticus TaxID=1674942 RepID=UPI001178BC19|nr:thiamine pyrophosphate-dependent enzyme [Caenibacillus caldisaponilyticus]
MGERMTAAEAIVRCMEIEGVTHAFCVPGESYLPILDALYQHPTIQLFAARHESGAAFMAEGFAKASGRPAVVMATRGVGAANLSIAVHTARQDSTPMVVFLGQVHRRFYGREGFQEMDVERFFAPIAKWAAEVRDPERVPELVQRAFRTAITGRPGPVVLAFPEDLLPVEIEPAFAEAAQPLRPHPSPQDIARAIDCLSRAERPVIIAGGGVKASAGETALQRFSDATGIPVLAAFRRHDVIPNDHPHYVGHVGLGTPSPILKTLQNADVVVAVGTRLSEVTTQDYSILARGQTLIHIDIDPEAIGKVFPVAVGIGADARAALEALRAAARDKLAPSKWKNWTSERRRAYEEASALTDVPEDDDPSGCNMKRIMKILCALLPKDTIIANDAGNFAGWLHTYYPFVKPQTYVGPTSGAMGYGFPAALGAKLAHPDRWVVSFSGDGGFAMTMQELATAAHYRIPVLALVFNNAMYGTIRMHQEMRYPGRVVATGLSEVDFAGAARALGVDGHRVTSSEAFERFLERLVDHPLTAPVLIEVKTDPNAIAVNATLSGLRASSIKP